MDAIDELAAKVAKRKATRKKVFRVALAAAFGALLVANPELANVLGSVVGTL